MLLSTHIVSDVEASAAALVVLQAGRIVFDGTPQALVAGARGRAWDWTIAPAQLAAARKAFVVSQSMHLGDACSCACSASARRARARWRSSPASRTPTPTCWRARRRRRAACCGGGLR